MLSKLIKITLVLASSEDVWDDSALIKAYDKAISLAKEEVSKRLGVHAQHPIKQKMSNHKEKQKSNKVHLLFC